MKKNLIVLQEGNKDCGAACLLSIIRYYGGDVSLERLIELTKTTKEGTTFYNIAKASSKFNLSVEAYKVDDIDKLKEVNIPFIAQINVDSYHHFVVVYKVENKLLLMDPSKGKISMDMFDFTNIWTGYIMLFKKMDNIPYIKNEKELNKVIIFAVLKNRNLIYFIMLLSIIFTILSSLISLYSQIVFDRVIDSSISNLIIITIIFSIFIIVKNITSYIRNHLLIYLNQKLDVNIILSTFSKVILLPYSYYKNKTTGEVLSRINDLSNIKNFISKIIIIIFLDILLFISTSIIIYNINNRILFLLYIIAFIYLIVVIIFNPFIKKISRQNIENTASMNNNIIESVSSFETVKGLNIEDNIIYKFSKMYSNTLNCSYKSEKINNIIILIKGLINDIGVLLVSYFSIKLIINNTITTGNYFTISFLSCYIINPIYNILDIMSEYHYIKNTIIRANNLLQIPSENFSSDKELSVNGNIIIRNLNYSYDNRKVILNNISFLINDKEKVLFLGPSGVGKSTVLKILYKYLECERDKIFINNYDINDYSLNDIRKSITYISQNELLYTDTIQNNILLDREINKEKYLDICKLTYINEIISDNQFGYDYMLEENGSNISGGQRQIIILARSLLKDSNIIMIDEGLNQIDINLERKILKNIFYYFRDKTIIIVSHRKDNMDLYDRVIKFSSDKAINLERRNTDE